MVCISTHPRLDWYARSARLKIGNWVIHVYALEYWQAARMAHPFERHLLVLLLAL